MQRGQVTCRGAGDFRSGAGVKGDWWVTYRGLQGVQVRHKGQGVGGSNG